MQELTQEERIKLEGDQLKQLARNPGLDLVKARFRKRLALAETERAQALREGKASVAIYHQGKEDEARWMVGVLDTLKNGVDSGVEPEAPLY